MNAIEGAYFDGGSSRKRPARLLWSPVGLTLFPENDESISIDPGQLQLTSTLAGAPTRISWGGEDSFVTLDHEGVAALRRDRGLGAGWLNRLEGRLSVALAAGVLCVALLSAFAFLGVPAIAARSAHYLPIELSDELGEVLLEQLATYLPPSDLSTMRQRELADYFTSHHDDGESIRVEFRGSETIGANALTFSASTVALTDELVLMAENDEELLAVYFHELGHARLRHVEQKVLTASAWLVMFGLLTGDVGVIGDVLLSTVLLGPALAPYSREFEREADAFAVDRLLDAGLSPGSMISILEKLEARSGYVNTARSEEADTGEADTGEADTGESGAATEPGETSEDDPFRRLLEALSSHPPTADRTAYIRSRMRSEARSAKPTRSNAL